MGQPKLLLRLGEHTVIARVQDALRTGGVDATYVLTRRDDRELQQQIRGNHVCSVVTDEPTADMRASVEILLRQMEVERHPSPEDAWLLVPADHPVLDADVVAALIAAWREKPVGIVVPVFDGRRGHPTLFGWPLAAQVSTIPAGEGLNRLLRDAPDQVREVAVPTAGILQDLDTPADYERLKLIVADD